MKFTQLFDERRAVSPVIGVILMVAITVILAAVIGTFVLGLSDQVGSDTPRASFGFEASNSDNADDDVDTVTITHESGDTIDSNNVQLRITGSSDSPWTWPVDEQISAGSQVNIVSSDESDDGDDVQATDLADLSGETVRIVYDSPDSDSTTTLQTFEISE